MPIGHEGFSESGADGVVVIPEYSSNWSFAALYGEPARERNKRIGANTQTVSYSNDSYPDSWH